MEVNKIIQGDTLKMLKTLPDNCVDTIATSPPYWGLRDYGIAGQLGLETTLDKYIKKLLSITWELQRVLKPLGVMFWNHGDCYGGTAAKGEWRDPKNPEGRNQVQGLTAKFMPKCLVLQNYRIILRMIDDQGWILRNTIIWHKPNAMPSSVKDRFANSYEPIFMLTKNKKYWFDLDAVRQPYAEPLNRWGGPSLKKGKSERYANMQKIGNSSALRVGRNMRPDETGKNPGDVWTIATQPFPQAHFATFPESLIKPIILSSCPRKICIKCKKARVRITEPSEEYAKRLGKAWHDHKEDNVKGQRYSKEIAGTPCSAEYKTIGWTKCKCNASWRPGITLDPFSGSGTVAIVAKGLGRDYLGIELNPEYIKIAKKRIANTMGRLL